MSGVGHAAPPGTAAHAPLPLALGMPDRNSWLILIGFLVALVLILWLIGRAVRKQGGFRRACRRIAWEIRMTARAFTAPLRAYLRHRRCARTLAAYFADPAAYDTARAALDRADADTGDGCYAPAVQLAQTRDRVRVVIAGRDPAGAAGPVLPWTDAAGEPGSGPGPHRPTRYGAPRATAGPYACRSSWAWTARCRAWCSSTGCAAPLRWASRATRRCPAACSRRWPRRWTGCRTGRRS